MTWWQAALVVWLIAQVAFGFLLASRRTDRSPRTDRPSLEQVREAGAPRASGAVQPLSSRLSNLLEEAERDPTALARYSGIEDLLALGYGIAQHLEDEGLRLGREIEELVDIGGPDAHGEVMDRSRKRREVERQELQLRGQLDALRGHAERAALHREHDG